MKLTIDIPSALITLSAVGIAAVLAGAAPIQATAGGRDVQAVEDLSRPHPRDFVRIQQGADFTVPAGRILVISAMAFADNPGANAFYQTIEVNGTPILSEYGHHGSHYSAETHDQKITAIPHGVAIPAGDVVRATSNRDDCVLLGHLVDA